MEKLGANAHEIELSHLVALAGLTPHPKWLAHRLADNLEGEALYSLKGVVDNYMGLCVLATYDSAMYFGGLALPSGAGLEIEDLLLPYVEGISLAGAGEAARSAT